MSSIYEEWGFWSNPFQTTALAPDSQGKDLLIGRDNELVKLRRRILNPPRLPTLEGLNVVGKSSLVNVAAYTCYLDFLNDPSNPLLIPCRKVFQFRSNQEFNDFVNDVYREVAQTLIEKAHEIEGIEGLKFNAREKQNQIDKWLNAPQRSAYHGGIGPFTGGYSIETNTGEGFSRSGFPKAVRDWLSTIFPTPQDGGVICIIDNLELLQTSESARQLIESLRDELLLIPGLRWVLCGVLGIVLGIASSPRLEGFLNDPIVISGIDQSCVEKIFDSRIKVFSKKNEPYLPIHRIDFSRLYHILSYNLRSLLSHADDYCQWCADNCIPNGDDEKKRIFDNWLQEMCRKAYESSQAQVGRRAWQVFEDAIAIDGIFAPSDFEHFQFNSIPAFRPHVKDLEAAGLVVSTQDDGDKRRKTVQVTSKGWLVHEFKNKLA